MSTTIENRIINLQFNNKDFERNAKQSMDTVNNLKKSLNFDGVGNALSGVESKFKSFGDKIKNALGVSATSMGQTVITNIVNEVNKANPFNALEEAAIGAFRRIGEQAVNLGEKVVKSLTIEQATAGWSKYEEKTKSVQTIMNATGLSIEEVTDQLAKLNWYTDETSYAYTDMTSNISKFTAAGVDLDTAVTAMIGIGNAAGLAGASVQDASHAMEGFSKAIGQGYMDRMSYSWLKTAHMDTQQLRKSFIDAAVAAGTLYKVGNGKWRDTGGEADDDISLENFEAQLTKAKWLTRDVMLSALNNYGSLTNQIYDIYTANNGELTTSEIIDQMGVSVEDLGLKAFRASQEAKTFADAVEAVKDAVSTGWMETFDIIFGNYVEAKKLWTDFANWLYDMFAESGNYRNNMFKIFMGRTAINEEEVLEAEKNGEKLERVYYKIGNQLQSGREYFLEAIYGFMEVISAYSEAISVAANKVFGGWDFETIGSVVEKIHRAAQLLRATLQKDLAMNPKEVSELEWIDNNNRNSFINKFRNSVERVFEIVRECINGIKDIGQTFYEVLYDSFGSQTDKSHGFYIEGFYKWFQALTISIFKFIRSIRIAFMTNDRLYQILNGIMSVGKIAFNVVKMIMDFVLQNGSVLIDIIAELAALVGDMVANINSGNLYDAIATLLPFTQEALSGILWIVGNLITLVLKAKDFLFDFITAFASLAKESGSMQEFAGAFVTLADSVGNLFGLDKVGGFFENFKESIMSGDKTLGELAAEAVDGAVVAVSGFMDSMAGFVDKLKTIVDSVKQMLNDAIGSIKEFASKIFGKGGTDFIGGGAPDEEETIFDTIKNKIAAIFDKTSGLGNVDTEKLKGTTSEYSSSILEGIIQGVKNVINALDDSGIDWEKIKMLGLFAGFIVTVIKITSLIGNVNKLIGNINDSIFDAIFGDLGKIITNTATAISKFSGLIGQATETLEDITKIKKLEAIGKIMAELVIMVLTLASVPEQMLAKGVTYMGLIGLILVGLSKALGSASTLVNTNIGNTTVTNSWLAGNKFDVKAGPLGWAAVILSMGYFISVFVETIEKMENLDSNAVLRASGVIIGIIAVMGIVLYALGTLSKYMQKTARNTSTATSTLSSGATSDKKISNYASTPTGAYFYSLAAAMMAVAVGVRVIVFAIEAFVEIIDTGKTGALVASLVIVFGIISMMVLSTVLMLHYAEQWTKNAAIKEDKLAKIGKTMLMIGASVAIIAAAVLLIVPAIVVLALAIAGINKIDESAIWIAFGTVMILLAAIIGYVALVIKEFKNLTAAQINRMGKAMILLATSVAIVAGSMVILVGSIIGLVTALAFITIVNNKLGGGDNGSVIIAIGTVAALMAAIMVFIVGLLFILKQFTEAQLKKLGGVMHQVGKMMLSIAGAVALMAVALAIMSKFGASWNHSGSLMLLLAGTISAVALLLIAINKLGINTNDIKNMSNIFITMAGSILVIALSIALIAQLDTAKMWDAMKGLGAALGALIVAIGFVVLLAGLANRFAGGAVVIAAFGALIKSMALWNLGVAATLLTFAIAMATITKCMGPLTEKMGPFAEALKNLLSSIKGYEGTLIAVGLAILALAAAVAVIVGVIIYLIYTYRTAIASALSSGFTHVQSMFTSFGTWLSGIPQKTKNMVAAIALAVAGGLALASPEVYEQIQIIFVNLMTRLGDSVGWITKGLLGFVINIINSLADAIRDNSGQIAYSLYNAFNAIAMVLLDLLNVIVAPLISAFIAPFLNFDEALSDIMLNNERKLKGEITLAESVKNANEIWRQMAAGEGKYGLGYDKATESVLGAFKNFKNTMEVGMNSLAEVYGVDPTKPLADLEKEALDEAKKQVESAKVDLKQAAKKQTTSIGDGIIEGADDIKDRVDGWFTTNFGTSGSSILSKLKNGKLLDSDSISSIVENLVGSTGSIDMSAYTDLTKMINLDGANPENMTMINDQLNLLGYNMDEIGAADLNLDITDASFDGAAQAAGEYTASLADASDAEQAFGNDADSMLRAVESREQSFFDAGVKLATAVDDGITSQWSTVSENILGKFRGLADEIRSMLNGMNVTVSVGSVTAVKTDENQNSIPNVNDNTSWSEARTIINSDNKVTGASSTRSAFGNTYDSYTSQNQGPDYSGIAAMIHDRKQYMDLSKQEEHLKNIESSFGTFNNKMDTLDNDVKQLSNSKVSVNLDGEKIGEFSWWYTEQKVNRQNRTGG